MMRARPNKGGGLFFNILPVKKELEAATFFVLPPFR